ncbi:MAG: DUF1566 domain-containing protein, partial [Anaerolineae bacterium]
MLPKLFALVILSGLLLAALLPGTASAQTPPDIIVGVSPASAAQGDTGVAVTITLDSQTPPTPPLEAALLGVSIGGVEATSFSRDSLTVVTATFDLPASADLHPAPLGLQDVSLTFEGPGGQALTFSEPAAFEILPAAPGPSLTIHKTVETQNTPAEPGETVTYTIVVANDGDAGVEATIGDTLPAGVQGDDLSWTGTIPADDEVAFTIQATVAQDPAYAGRTIVNTARVSYAGGSGSASASFVAAGTPLEGSYAVVDTGQVACYDAGAEIACPAEGQAFYGQDAQHDGNLPSYTPSADGLTVYDNVTGLTWTQSPDTDGDGDIDADDKLAADQVQTYVEALNAQAYGGYDDWRLPSIKELYSLIDFRGTDPIPEATGSSGLVPYIDTDYFAFAYGDTAAGERIIDAQFLSSTSYVGTVFNGQSAIFGVNFADGRIKGYPSGTTPGGIKTFYVRYVRGNPDYGQNDFFDNLDGTITDQATGLMWSQADSGTALNWEEALAWVEQKNAENYLGYDDWRLPNAKELQSIVDYSRAPDAQDPAQVGPAIDPVFDITSDDSYFWSSTTHVEGPQGDYAAYVSFGEA